MIKPFAIDEEIELDKNRYILSVTDLKGNITKVNDYFVEVCGYSKDELLGSPHNIIRHPDMPKAIFYLMWQYIQNDKNITAVVKNLAKDGRYYWVVTHFNIGRDELGRRDRYTAFRYKVPKKVIRSIEPLYRKLLQIEKDSGMKESVEYFMKHLEKKGMDYNQFIKKLEKRGNISSLVMSKFENFFR